MTGQPRRPGADTAAASESADHRACRSASSGTTRADRRTAVQNERISRARPTSAGYRVWLGIWLAPHGADLERL
jgi:hypothetical protein